MKPRLVLPAIVLGFALPSVDAHDPGFSTAVVTVGAREIEAVVTYATREVADRADLPGAPAFLINETLPEPPLREQSGGDDNSIFRLKSPRPADGGVTLSAPLLDQLAPGHRQHLLIRDAENGVLMNRFLHRGETVASLALSPLPVPAHRLGSLLPAIASAVLVLVLLPILLRYRRSYRKGRRFP